MNSQPLISVVIPTYNAYKYILETLESVFNQDYPGAEIIVIDDGSTDSTRETLAEYIESGRIQYKYIDNSGGPSVPRNIGLEKSSGECIFIFDSDDVMMPGKINKTMELYKKTIDMDVGLFFTDFIRIDENSKQKSGSFLSEYNTFQKMPKRRINDYGYFIDKESAYEGLLHDNYIGTSSVMIPRKIVDQGYRFDEGLKNADDIDMWYRISDKFNLAYVDIEGHGYRSRPGSVFNRGSSHKYLNRYIVRERQLIRARNTEQRVLIKSKLTEILFSAGYFHQNRGEYKMARSFYIKGFIKTHSWLFLRGIFVTFIKQFCSIINRPTAS